MFTKKSEEVFKELQTNLNGLSQNEAIRRQKKYGKNEIKKEKKQSFLKVFFKQFLNIMVAILLVSAVVSISIAVFNKNYSDIFEGVIILFIVVMNALIGVFQERKAQACLEDLQKYNKVSVKTLRDGKWKMLDSTELVVGDIVEMQAGNIVMADVRLVETNNFSCDESSLTGESVPVEKSATLVLKPTTPLAERCNMAYSGSMITRGKAVGVVTQIGDETELGKIAKIILKTKKDITPLQKSIDKIGKIITWTVLAVCAVILSLELISGNNILNSLMISVALAVAAIPESLPAVITIIMALGVQQLARRRCIIKRLHAVETLGSCQIICTDKTGTLTLNKMKVVKAFSNDSYDEKSFDGEFLNCLNICTSTIKENNTITGEPTEVAIKEFAIKFDFKEKKKLFEFPFDSTRKMMSVVVYDNGNKSYTKGAPEVIIKNCKYIRINNQIIEFDINLKQKIQKINDQMTDEALRVIAFAYKQCGEVSSKETEKDMIFVGLVGIMDTIRPEVKYSIQRCFKAGLKPVMITGDHKRTAFAIAKEIGIANKIEDVLTGEEIEQMSDLQLSKICMNYSVFARVSPEHKVKIVNAYKKCNKIVAMTGDGVNDAPSLKIADIGVGMGKNGTDVVKNTADLLITDDNFTSIVIAVEEGRKVYTNIQKALQFLISTNCVEVFGMLLTLMFFPNVTFLLPAQMLFVNLVTDSLPAFALGVEKVEPEIMLEPPRNPKSGLFGGKVGVSIIYQAVLQTIIVIAVFVVGIFCYSPSVASTMSFFAIIFMQLLHSVNCKTNGSIFEHNLFENKTFNICFIVTLFLNLSVACLPFMYKIFGLEFLNLSQWIIVLIGSTLIIPTCELFKAILIKENNKKFKNSFKKLSKKA